MNRIDFDTLPINERFRVREKSSGDVFRAKKESEDNVFVYAKGKSRYGYRMMTETFLLWYDLIPTKSPEEVWKKKVDGVVKRLEKSGLWPDLLDKFKNLQTVSYSDREEMKKIEMFLPWNASDEAKNIAYGKYRVKYPFIFGEDAGPDWFYLYGLSDCKTKSMYFGKYTNTSAKENIKRAMIEGRRVTEYGRTSYDVSFEYDPEKKKAWYSEEYKDCGNGHYYLALDGSCALFCEDD